MFSGNTLTDTPRHVLSAIWAFLGPLKLICKMNPHDTYMFWYLWIPSPLASTTSCSSASNALSRAVAIEFLGKEMKSSQFPPERVRGQPGSFPYEKCLLTVIFESLIHFIPLLILLFHKLASCLLTDPVIYTNKPNDRHLFQLRTSSALASLCPRVTEHPGEGPRPVLLQQPLLMSLWSSFWGAPPNPIIHYLLLDPLPVFVVCSC